MADLRTQLANLMLAELTKQPFESPEEVVRKSYEIADSMIAIWQAGAEPEEPDDAEMA